MVEPKKIAIIMYQTSVVVKGIEKNLTEAGCKVSSVVGELGNLNSLLELTDNVDLLIVYLPGNIADEPMKLSLLEKMTEAVVEKRKRMILIGEKNDYADVTRKVPAVRSFRWLDRPVGIETLKDAIENDDMMPVAEGEKKRILIVDDDPSYARMVREWIKDFYKVDIVTAGMQAITFLLKVAEKDKVDMILLDYEMPVVDGPQVLQMLRQEPVTADIPVVFLTGVGNRESVTRVMGLKPAGYILKTTTREDILHFLKEKLYK